MHHAAATDFMSNPIIPSFPDVSPASQRGACLAALLQQGDAVLVRVLRVQGSAPRGAGTWMAVGSRALLGTIGGGRLEHEAIGLARQHLATGLPCLPNESAPLRCALGPSLGQCCGGVVHLSFERVAAPQLGALQAELLEAPRQHFTPVALFGGGHVGLALVRVLAPLPFALTWLDSRDGVFPAPPPTGVVCEHSEPVQSAVPALAAQSRVLIMSFSHAEDLDVLAACLLRQRLHGDLPFIGLIGSQTKWATFGHRLAARGFSAPELAHVTCPIGVRGIQGKAPEVIAVAVAAQLLQTLVV
jgi:xanthine dehydrogenase accessory factor